VGADPWTAPDGAQYRTCASQCVIDFQQNYSRATIPQTVGGITLAKQCLDTCAPYMPKLRSSGVACE